MHVETLAYMLHQLPFDMKVQATRIHRFVAGPPVAHRMVSIPAGRVTLGLRAELETFGWDNEYEAHTSKFPRLKSIDTR